MLFTLHGYSLPLPYPFTLFSRDHHRPGKLSCRTRRAVAENQKSGLALAVPFLVKDFCRQLWHGRGLRAGDGLPVRHQLERIFTVCGQHYRPLLTYEVLTAFFLEAGFLGVMLFGWNKVGPGLHFFSTCMVALGTIISTFWILSSNSWMQTPQGYEIVNGQVVPVDWFAVVFNPSFPYRLLHMSIAAFLSSALFVGASAAWHLLRGIIPLPYGQCFRWRCG